jgi:hypothetical protein
MPRDSRTSGLMRCSASSCSRNSSGLNGGQDLTCRFTAAKSPGHSWSSLPAAHCAPVSARGVAPSSASVTNIRSRCGVVSGLNLILKVKRRSAAWSMRSIRLVVQTKMPAKRSMPCSISLTSVTS